MNPSSTLILASLSLLVGPLCRSLGGQSRAVRELVDGFALMLVAGLSIVFILPHVVSAIGFVGVILTATGIAVSLLAHRVGPDRLYSLSLVALALFAHAVVDGAALSQGAETPLAWAIVAHRLPVGFAIVVAVHALRGSFWVSWGLALAMILATICGYLVGPTVLAHLPKAAHVGFEAIVAGVLLHIVFAPRRSPNESHECSHGHHHHENHHHRHDHHHHHPSAATYVARWSAVGALCGLLVMLSGPVLVGSHGLERGVVIFLRTLGVLVLESAPALLLGYALAGVVPFLLTPTRVNTLARGGRIVQALRGVVFGLPLPICSCGVLPLYESLVKRGAPATAALAFFVATPELGLDAVLLSVPLLGPTLASARVVSAFVVALLVALWIGERTTSSAPTRHLSEPNATAQHWLSRVRSGLRFGFVEIFDHTMPWIVLGLVVAAMAEPMLSHGALQSVPVFLQAPVAALVGVPLYVCASGATPVAALALHKGLSTGAAIAFLIAGPATNLTTFGVLTRLHGRGTAIRFGACMMTLAVLAGWTVDALKLPAAPVLDAHPEVLTHGSWLGSFCAICLVPLAIASLLRQGPRGMLRQILKPIHAH